MDASRTPSRLPAPFAQWSGPAVDLLRDARWDEHALGPPERWPGSLRAAVAFVLSSSESLFLVWGERRNFFFNDAYLPILGPRRDHAMGACFPELWADAWPRISDAFEGAEAGRSSRFADLPLTLARRDVPEETWWNYSVSPWFDADATIPGVLCVVTETTGRVLAADLARRTETRNRQILDSAVDYAIIATDRAGLVTRWNEGASRILGWSEAEMLGQSAHRFFTPEDVAQGRVETEMTEALEHGRGNDERWHRRRNGEHFWAAGEMTVLRDEGGVGIGFVRVLRDRTEQHRTVEALSESEAKFRAFAEAVPNQIWTAKPDGTLDWGNQRAYDYNGVDRREPNVDAAKWRTHVHPDDHAAVIAAWMHAVQSGDRYEIEFRQRRGDGAYRWHLARALPLRDADDRIVRWVGSNTDIDDQRAAREVLVDLNAALAIRVAQEARERDRLWSTTNDLMGTAGFDGYLRKINPAWSALLGHDEQTLLGRPFLEIIDPADHDQTAEVLARLQRGETVNGFVDHLRAADGTVRVVSWNAVPEGDVFYIVGRDVTEQHAYEERLRQSQKMEAVGQLTGGIAHDFNNMLTGVIGSMDLLKRHLSAGRIDRVDRYIDAATTSAQRAAALTQRLLAFSRRQSLDVRAVAVDALLAEMEELLHRTLGEKVALRVVPGAAVWPVTTDANQLENALLNLVINARDAMPDGGRLTIETRNTRLDEAYASRFDDLSAGDFVAIAVTDTGTGMTPAVIAKAFDPFFTTKPIGEGTGLGLSMIYGFAKQSGGHVRIHSQPGIGTTVTLYLPRDMSERIEVASPEPAPSQGALAGEHVLLVEDDPAVRMLVVDVLRDLGYRVTEAADGREAMPLIASMPRIDLLVTDVGLPGMNGRQVAELAREKRPGLKVLFVTGYAEQAAIRGDFLGEGMDMIAKPFAIDALSAKIRGVIGG